MSEYVVFASDHPVTLRWIAAGGTSCLQQARLHDVSDTRLVIEVPWRETYNPPAIGDEVTAEAADAKGGCLALFRGTVKTVASRQIDIRLERSMDVVQRRTHPRVRVPFGFHTAIHRAEEGPQYFLAHPIDLSVGGIRILHRLPLQAGDEFRFIFRPRAGITITISAQVIMSQPVAGTGHAGKRPSYATRARFIDLSEMNKRFLTRYVGWLLGNRN